jgi:hypothetical protein
MNLTSASLGSVNKASNSASLAIVRGMSLMDSRIYQKLALTRDKNRRN